MRGFKVKTSKSKGSLITVDTCSIDADIVAYKVTSACDGKYYIYEDKEYRLLKEIPKGYDRGAVGEAYDPDEWEDVASSIKSMIKTIQYDIEAKEYLCFMSRGSTFRHEVASILPYKGNRDGSRRIPVWLKDAKEFIADEYGGIFGDGVEADDMLYKGDVIASIDKDLLVVPRVHYNIDKRSITTVTQLEADKYFYKQVLTGDKTDNILGLFGVGAKSAYCNRVESCKCVEDMHAVVYSAYKERFGSYASDMMEENCILLWILQDREPYFKGVFNGKS